MSNLISINKLLKDRDAIVKEQLSQANPLVVVKTEEGILLVTENPTICFRKIIEIYDRIAFGAIGKQIQFEKLKEVIVSQAIMTGANYAREDVQVVGLAKKLGAMLDEIYSHYQKLPWSVEIVLVEVNDRPENDKLLTILFNGSIVSNNQPYIVLGRNEALKAKIDKLFNKEGKFRIEEVIKQVKEAIIDSRNSEDIKFEIGILWRNKPVGKKFERR